MAPHGTAVLLLLRNAIEPLSRDFSQFPEAARIHRWLTAIPTGRDLMLGSLWQTTESLLGKLDLRPDLVEVRDRLVTAWNEVNRFFVS